MTPPVFTLLPSNPMKHITALLCILCISVLLKPNSAGAQWTECDVPVSYPVTNVTAASGSIFAGLSGKGLLHSTDDGETWKPVSSQFESEAIKAVGAFSGVLLVATVSSVFRSSDDGASWGIVTSGLETVAVSAFTSVGARILAATDDGVYASVDKGVSWAPAGTGIPSMTGVTSLAVIGQNVFAGTNFYGVYLSTNAGTAWKQANNGLKPTTVSCLTVIGQRLFAGSSSGVYMSTNNASSWAAANTGRLYDIVSAFSSIGNELYAGSDKGLYRTTDFGTSWGDVGTGLGSKHVAFLALGSKNMFVGLTFLGSGVSSVWMRPISEMSSASVQKTNDELPFRISRVSANPFTDETQLDFTCREAVAVRFEVFDVLGKRVYNGGEKVYSEGENHIVLAGESLPHDMLYARFSASDGSVRTVKIRRAE
jgi:ligand-binding sensor domain-containing protein